MEQINGKVYPLWSQFVERKKEWISGELADSGDSMDKAMGYGGDKTEITDIQLVKNGDDSALFRVCGKAFDCAFDVRHGGISGGGDKDAINFSGFGGHSWSIKKP